MPFQLPRQSSVLASVLAAAGIMLAVASCGNLTPLGPQPAAATTPPPRHLGSPIILQVMAGQPFPATGGCPAGWEAPSVPPGAAPMGCYRSVGTPVTITTAAISPVSALPSGPPGHPESPVPYGFTVTVPAADAAAVTAVSTQAFSSGNAFGVIVAGKTWEAAQIGGIQPSPSRQFQIALLSKNQALQLYRILVPAS